MKSEQQTTGERQRPRARREENVTEERRPDESATRRRKLQSAHFEKFAEDGNRFIREVANELGTSNIQKALRITKAVLHAIRDRLQPDSAVEFAQGLPMMLKAIYFDQYDISGTPVIIRSQQGFIDFIREKDAFASEMDFQDPQDAIIALQIVFSVLENHMDYYQVRQIKKQLPKEIQNMIDRYKPYAL